MFSTTHVTTHRMRLIALALIASLIGLLVQTPLNAQAQNTLWTVEYYNNPTLSGVPVYTTQVATVGFNWTADPPAPGVPADNYSMRYTGVQTLSGNYQLRARADDGVRVYLDGQLVINAFATSSGQTYTYPFAAAPGQHTVVVEYYEGGGVAFLEFAIEPLGTVPTPGPVTASGTVTAWVLNVRSAPNPTTGAILTKITRGQVYPVVGRNAQGSWWQINVNGTVGWVNSNYFTAVNTQNVPITDGGVTPTPTAYRATAYLNLNIRSGPGTQHGVIGWIPAYQAATIIGRNAASTWWNVTYGTTTGWISAAYASVNPTPNLNAIPITDTGTVPQPSTFTATAVGNLNIRTGPNAAYPRVGWLPLGETVQVFGRSASGTWYQIRYGAIAGWASGSYLRFPPGTAINQLPVTG